MQIKRFEDIRAWQEARTLTKQIYSLSNYGKFSRDFGLRDQIQRAATSIMANISEGFDSKSKSEFIQFLYYAKRSNSELQSHLYIALDQQYITQEQFDRVYTMSAHVQSLIGGFIRYLLGKSVNFSTLAP